MKRLLIHVGWVFFDRMFRIATGMLVGIWLARYLGPAQFGLLNYALVFPLMLSALASLGINSLLFTEIPLSTTPAQTDRVVLTAVLLKLLSGTLAFGLIMGANYLLYQNNPQRLLLISLSATMLIVQGFDAVDVYFQSVRQVQYSVIPKVGAFVLGTAARVWGLFSGAGLAYFLTISLLELTTGCVVVWLVYLHRRKLSPFRWPVDLSLARRLLRLSWPLMLAEFFIFAYTRLDQIMLETMVGSAELGRYSATLRLSETWYFVGAALTTALYPSIISVRATDYPTYLRRYQSLLNTLAGLGIGLGVFMTLLAAPITQLIYGSQYAGIDALLRIHIWTGLFVFIAVGTSNWFVVEGMQSLLMVRTLTGAVLNLLLNLVLIPRYGATGASAATLVAQIVAAYLTNGVLSKTREVFLLQTKALFFIPRWLGQQISLSTFSPKP